jgi:hypothetical protein
MAVPKRATSPRTSGRAARRANPCCLVRHTLQLSRARAATGQSAALHPHGLQIRTGVRCFSLRRLLYFAAVLGSRTLRSHFRIMAFDLGWSYRDSNPRPLACHTVATRPQKYICAGHCLGTSASVPRNPGLLLYFRAYSPELPPVQAERAGSREAHAGHSTGLYLPATRDRRRERPSSPATSARYRPLEKRTAGRRKPADPAHVTTLRTSKRPPVAHSGTD